MELPIVKKSDIICIISPAGALKPKDIQETIQQFQSKGFVVELGKHTFSYYINGYNYAGTPAQRLEDLQWALNHPTAKAIWFARGGYGGIHLVDNLELSHFLKHPKWIMGYSDNTIFHQFFSQHNIPTLHSVTVKPLSENQTPESYDTLAEIIQNKLPIYRFDSSKYNTIGKVKTNITGGNLSIIYSLLGSKTLDDFNNKILFIEDWQENWYHLDRMLNSLERAGVFTQISGLLVGSFTKMDTQDENPSYLSSFDEQSYQIIHQKVEKYKFPKAFGFSGGHINHNLPIVLGKEAELNVGEYESELKF